jgi:copper(I)-binding protein
MIRKSASRTASAALLGLSLLAVTTAAIAQHGTKAGTLVIEAPWTRATPGGAKVAGGYLKITNTGRTPDRLIGGTFPSAASVEVHAMSMSGGIMKMRRLEKGLVIAPGASVELEPGGLHMMFVGLSAGLEAGGTIKGTLVFEKAGTVAVEYRIAPIGSSAAPKHGH